jgi:biotin carboxylase
MNILKILVLDPEWEQTAYLVRSLAGAGFEVVLASTLAADPLGIGRYCRQVVMSGSLADPERLARLLSEEPADIVLPLCEDFLATLWALPDHLTAKVFPQTSGRQRELLADRRAMYRFVSEVGVPLPESLTVADESALQEVVAQLGFPFVLRGTQGLAGQQVRVVDDIDQAVSAYAYLKAHSPGSPFAQRFVAGQRCLIGGLFDDGEMLQWFSQTTVEARSATGPSIRVSSIRDDRLTEYARKLFEELRWSGLACAEFIRDAQGDFHFLEINPRPWAAIRAADCCGVPLLDMFAHFLLGQRPGKQVDFPAGREVALFPQFVAARLSAGRLLQWSDRQAYFGILAKLPWGSPPLMLHLLRRIWWARS